MTNFYHEEVKNSINFSERLFDRVKKECDTGFLKKRIFLLCDVREMIDIISFKNKYHYYST
jgi:hypothetical protein